MYRDDFRFFDSKAKARIVEDVKGHKRGAAYQLFRLKKRLVETCSLGAEIEEV